MEPVIFYAISPLGNGRNKLVVRPLAAAKPVVEGI
jgi:hypothetical protein